MCKAMQVITDFMLCHKIGQFTLASTVPEPYHIPFPVQHSSLYDWGVRDVPFYILLKF